MLPLYIDVNGFHRNKEVVMLDIIHRIGIVCYRFCYITGTILVILGFLINISSEGTAVYIFYYLFALVLFIIGFLMRYIFYGNGS